MSSKSAFTGENASAQNFLFFRVMLNGGQMHGPLLFFLVEIIYGLVKLSFDTKLVGVKINRFSFFRSLFSRNS